MKLTKKASLCVPHLKEKHQPVSHPAEVLKEIEAIVARANKELAG